MVHKRHLMMSLTFVIALFGTTLGALAQTASPEIDTAPAIDLAAIALSPEDVPTGFFDDYSEWWVPAGAFVGIIGDATPPAGLERAYQSFYVSNDSPLVINTFLLEFESPEAAAMGAGIVDAALRPPLPDGTSSDPSHAAGPQIGNSLSTLTSVSYDTRSAGGPFVSVVASSFVHETIVAAVSIESYIDPPGEGSPVPVGTPDSLDLSSQAELASHLASVLDSRIEIGLHGGELDGVNAALSDRLLPLQQLVSDDTPVLGGYKAGADLLACRVCGEENSLGVFGKASLGGLVRAVVAGPMVDGEPSPPFIAVAISQFATANDALTVLDAIRSMPNDLPTPYPVPRGERTVASDPTVPGTDATAAYTGVLNPDDPEATPDSAGVAFVVDNSLVTIDVQGGLTANEAMAIAVDLATQQADCLASIDPCSTVTFELPALAE